METLRELFKHHFEAALKVLLFHCEPEMWALLSQRLVNVTSDICGILFFFRIPSSQF